VRAFIDSHIAVHALGPEDDPRCRIADALLARHGSDCEPVVSTQVLLETYKVLVRKRQIKAAQALAATQVLMRYEVVAPSAAAAVAALRLAAEHGLPTCDALIVQAALEGGCDTLYSEGLQAGRRFGKLLVVNPFDSAGHEPAPTYRAATRTRKARCRRVRVGRAAPTARSGPPAPAGPAGPWPRRRG
jgi:predicted nucleic acid-binding protein